MIFILDGTGRGYRWAINELHRGQIDAVVETEETDVCERTGLAFVASTQIVKLTNSNPHLLLYMKNTNPDRTMRIQVANFGWNGGDTNHDRCMEWTWVVGLNEPTANHTAVTPANLNLLSGQAAQATVYKWDGVGQGMTYTGGVTGSQEIYAKGTNKIDARGIPIIGLNQSVGMVIRGEEIGNAAVTIRFYYK